MKTIVITGATSGIGLLSALKFSLSGYNVIGVGHSLENCEKAEKYIRASNIQANTVWFAADLMQQREVNHISGDIAKYLVSNCAGKLDALINNAGCIRSWYMTTEEGYEQQFALNYLAGFLLTYRLLPYIQADGGRVIMTSSGSHKGIKVHWDDIMLSRHYNPLTAYKQSKLCDTLFAKGLKDRGINAYAVDPGLVKTDIGNKKTGGLVNLVWSIRKRGGVAPDIPAETYLYLCEQNTPPEGLYYYLCCEAKMSPQVTSENAARLFRLSEQLCEISYDNREVKE